MELKTIRWSFTSNGMFSVKSSYEVIMKSLTTEPKNEGTWDKIWKGVMLPQPKTVVLLARHDRLLTNGLKFERSFEKATTCGIYVDHWDSTIHAIRDLHGSHEVAAIAWLLRNWKGDWVSGLKGNIGYCNPLGTELWAFGEDWSSLLRLELQG
ncbi:hypothetical protein U1Q18_016953 [Sarracenia purpurea var. burkii]